MKGKNLPITYKTYFKLLLGLIAFFAALYLDSFAFAIVFSIIGLIFINNGYDHLVNEVFKQNSENLNK